MYTSMLTLPASVFHDVARLRRDLEGTFGVAVAQRRHAPAINVGHTPTSVEIQVFVPGVDAAKVDVSLERGVLTISGERPATVQQAIGSTGDQAADQGEAQVSVHSSERASGRFQRAVNLPNDADPERVQATYRDGVLHISVARREAAQARRIVIQ